VTHQGAEYFIAAPQGGGTGDISVYDVAAKVEGVTIAEHVNRSRDRQRAAARGRALRHSQRQHAAAHAVEQEVV
jgi:hypothetical protein